MNISMDEKETFGYVITGFLPLLIAAVQQPTWSDRKRSLVALLVVWAFVFLYWLYMWASEASLGALTFTPSVALQLGRMLVISLVVSVTSYQGLWKPTGTTGTVEVATSPPSVARNALEVETKRRIRPPRAPEVPPNG